MANHLYCPICGSKVHAEYVDIGVGYQQVEPHYCPKCTWVEGNCLAEECSKKCTAWDYCGGRSFGQSSTPVNDPNKAAQIKVNYGGEG